MNANSLGSSYFTKTAHGVSKISKLRVYFSACSLIVIFQEELQFYLKN